MDNKTVMQETQLEPDHTDRLGLDFYEIWVGDECQSTTTHIVWFDGTMPSRVRAKVVGTNTDYEFCLEEDEHDYSVTLHIMRSISAGPQLNRLEVQDLRPEECMHQGKQRLYPFGVARKACQAVRGPSSNWLKSQHTVS
jgi:hypothetical protein